MIDKTRLAVCGLSLVGWREDTNSIYSTLTAAQQASNSGFYFNDLAGLDFEVIEAALSENATDAKTYLENVYESELLSILTQFIDNNKANGSTKELLSNKNLTSGVAKFKDTVVQNARFVGFYIRPKFSNNIRTTITRIGMQSTVTQSALKIFLYETSQNEAIKTIDINVDKKLSLVWEEVADFIVNYQSKDGGTDQEFMYGYYEKDPNNPQPYQLQGEALRMEFDCGCRNSPKLMWSKFLDVFPIEIQNDDLNFDAGDNEYKIPTPENIWDNTTKETYGLQATINVVCEVTELVCSNISMFSKALQHAVAVRVLLDASSTKRINSIADSKAAELREYAVFYQGVLNGYTTEDDKEIKGLLDILTLDFAGLDPKCAPCKDDQIKFANLIR